MLQNKETRAIKIKFKDENKQPYSLEQLKEILNRNKYWLLFK